MRVIIAPSGFRYLTFGVEGTTMSDGNPTPNAHDGMAAFRLPNGHIRLIRNHEDRDNPTSSQLKGNQATAYDPRAGGSCMSLEIEVTSSGERKLVRVGEPGNLGYTFAIWGPWKAGTL